ncbi:MAG: CopD family protein [Methylococcus sp.]|nr:CopD family protein [Methylococcus sp.]
MLSLSLALHVLSAVLWVGGMLFAHQALRPAAGLLQEPERLKLWSAVFGHFFPWVKAAIVLLFLTGFGLIRAYGGFGQVGWPVHLMLLIALTMTVIFGVIYARPYKALKAAVAAEDWPAGSEALGVIRRLVGINLLLGLMTVAVASGGRFLAV